MPQTSHQNQVQQHSSIFNHRRRNEGELWISWKLSTKEGVEFMHVVIIPTVMMCHVRISASTAVRRKERWEMKNGYNSFVHNLLKIKYYCYAFNRSNLNLLCRHAYCLVLETLLNRIVNSCAFNNNLGNNSIIV